MDYIGEINGTELYHGENGSVVAEFTSGKWIRSMECCVGPWQLADLRKVLITTQSTQKCLIAAHALVRKICSIDLFVQIPQELFDVVTMYLSACYPWQMRPMRESPIPLRLDPFDVTNMIQCPMPRLSILGAKHVINANGPIESYNGVIAYGWDSLVLRTEYDSKIEWSSGPPNLVYCTLAQIMLEARRKEILDD